MLSEPNPSHICRLGLTLPAEYSYPEDHLNFIFTFRAKSTCTSKAKIAKSGIRLLTIKIDFH